MVSEGKIKLILLLYLNKVKYHTKFILAPLLSFLPTFQLSKQALCNS